MTHERGVTLIEVLVVVAIIAMVSTGVAVAAMYFHGRAQEKTASTNATSIRGAVPAYWMTNEADDCPGIDLLISSGLLDETSPRTDPWGQPWRIRCSGKSVSVSSNGPDKREGTADDIDVPRRKASL